MPVSKKRKRKRGAARPARTRVQARAATPAKGVDNPGPPSDVRALEAVTARLARTVSGRARHVLLEEAQDLVYEAWETDGPEREALARDALGIHPDCADAYTILAEAADSPEEAIPLYRRGVEAARRTLGAKPFAENVGHFWGFFETRPYMRARAGLAEALWATGAHDEALAAFADLLRLNERDNQGIRFVLLPRLLERERDEDARRLLDRFDDDPTAQWAWARALLSFRREGATERAELELQRARKANIRVEEYLTGLEPIPIALPDTVGFGDESEAAVCAAEQVEAWRATPGAIEWVREVAGLPEPPPPPGDIAARSAFLSDDAAIALDLTHPDLRTLVVLGDHPELHAAIDDGLETIDIDGSEVNPRLHLSIHEIVAAQIIEDDPTETWTTARRLRSLGYDRHEVLHMIASVVMRHLWRLLRQGKAFDRQAFVRGLDALPGSSEGLRV